MQFYQDVRPYRLIKLAQKNTAEAVFYDAERLRDYLNLFSLWTFFAIS